jgi:hypothetical protein
MGVSFSSLFVMILLRSRRFGGLALRERPWPAARWPRRSPSSGEWFHSRPRRSCGNGRCHPSRECAFRSLNQMSPGCAWLPDYGSCSERTLQLSHLEASITPEGVLLKPMSVVQRERAWQRIKEITAQVVDTQPNPAEEERIADEVRVPGLSHLFVDTQS